ncbi:hypothetical protein [Halopiger aswanensis]|uniref:Uncharacterized protein n=1 Tax=Halopiger aswanensis TaxID=148449 RepID=A0A419WJU2_9EURY|nr:hypothetical protein [Halopiger aswanensis]RKD95750.1 hypothetical protein ATJ93_2612 [Halopiger aswanensis]
MLRSIVGAFVDVLFGRLLLLLVLGIPAFAVVALLAGGTDLLVSIGLSRSVAGTITAGLATVGSIAGLAAFGYYAIDW